MGTNKQDIISGQVVIKKEARRDAYNIMESFRNAGFEVGALVGNNFSITGPRALFERNVSPQSQLAGDARSAAALAAVNPEIQALVERVVFQEGKYEWFR
jgi:hypothetical protein